MRSSPKCEQADHGVALLNTNQTVPEQLRQVLNLTEQAAAHVGLSAELLDDAFEVLTSLLSGSNQQDSMELLITLTEARDTCQRLIDSLTRARSDVETILTRVTRLIGDGIARDQAVQHVQKNIAAGIKGTQAQGAWIRPDGSTEDLHSGDHPPWFEVAKSELTKMGGPNGRKLARLARHVEVRLIFQLRHEILTGKRDKDIPVNETLVMDRPPCFAPPQPPAPFSCHYQLGNIIRVALPAGSTLTVMTSDGKVRVYPKEAKQ